MVVSKKQIICYYLLDFLLHPMPSKVSVMKPVGLANPWKCLVSYLVYLFSGYTVMTVVLISKQTRLSGLTVINYIIFSRELIILLYHISYGQNKIYQC